MLSVPSVFAIPVRAKVGTGALTEKATPVSMSPWSSVPPAVVFVSTIVNEPLLALEYTKLTLAETVFPVWLLTPVAENELVKSAREGEGDRIAAIAANKTANFNFAMV